MKPNFRNYTPVDESQILKTERYTERNLNYSGRKQIAAAAAAADSTEAKD